MTDLNNIAVKGNNLADFVDYEKAFNPMDLEQW